MNVLERIKVLIAMALIHLWFFWGEGGDSPLGYVKNTVLLFFSRQNCIIKHNDSTKQDYNLEGFFPIQYIYKYVVWKSATLNILSSVLFSVPTVSHRTLGHVSVNLTEPHSMESLAGVYPQVRLGGTWRPPHCKSRSRVALVLPFRNREKALKIFLQHIHGFLQRQLIDYRIFVIEQVSTLGQYSPPLDMYAPSVFSPYNENWWHRSIPDIMTLF